VLVGTWAAAREAIARRGVVVHDAEGSWTARVGSVDPAEAPTGAPLALVLVKSHQTSTAAALLARVLAPDGLAVTLQNGLGPRETLAARLGPGRVGVGVATIGARLLAPGEVRVAGGRILLGESERTLSAIRGLAERMRAGGLDVATTPEPRAAIWAKLAANCAINPLTALHGITNGALLEDPEKSALLVAAAREVGAVAEAAGVKIEGDAGAFAQRVARETATNRSSMLQDLERGAPTEIDALCGAVAALGRRLGVEAPVNERLWREVRAREGRPVEGEPDPGPRRPLAGEAPRVRR